MRKLINLNKIKENKLYIIDLLKIFDMIIEQAFFELLEIQGGRS